jgi:protein-S-isoprenylcysteine O-methyltransferase Ste14
LLLDEAALVLAVIAVGIAVRKWHAVRDRRLLLSVMRNALKERKALWVGILTAVFYLAIFMILGGQGGRVHLLFGRVIWNTSPGDMLAGILLALLVMLSMALFIYGVQVMGARWSGRQGGMGIIGSVLALLAAFCP